MRIGDFKIGDRTLIVAELSANHGTTFVLQGRQ